MNKKPPSIKVIKAKEPSQGDTPQAKLNVCAYCRVSSDHDEQLNSYKAQVDHYTNLITTTPNWNLVGIYKDEGITGTSTEKRADFQKMIQDCKNGKIDLIITKSISRFSRNTKDFIETIRLLNSLNINIFFEDQNINSNDTNAEFMLNILSSIAQEESLNISKNQKWRIQKDFQSGDYVPSFLPYGYTKNEKGEIIPDPENSKIVKEIFTRYLNSESTKAIADDLNKRNILTKKQQPNRKWSVRTIMEMLKNEKYIGNMLMQKTYTTDSLPLTKKINYGERNQYLVENNHEAIITKEDFIKVSQLINLKLKLKYKTPQSKYFLSSKISCQNCGANLRRVTTGEGDNKKIKWGCPNHKKKTCSTKDISEDDFYKKFIRLRNKLSTNKTFLINMLELIKLLETSENLETKNKILEIEKQYQILSELKAKKIIDTAIFMEKYENLNKDKENIKADANKENESDKKIIDETKKLVTYMKSIELITTKFIEEEYETIIKSSKLNNDGEIIFTLKNDLELK